MKKKILSILTTVLLIGGGFPTIASAETVNLKESINTTKLQQSASSYNRVDCVLRMTNPGEDGSPEFYGHLNLIVEYADGTVNTVKTVFYRPYDATWNSNDYSDSLEVDVPEFQNGYQIKKMGLAGYVKESDFWNADDDILKSKTYLSNITRSSDGKLTCSIYETTSGNTFSAKLTLIPS